MCIILKKEDINVKSAEEEITVYKILKEKSGNLYSPEMGTIWKEKIGERKSVNILSTTEKNGFIYTKEGLYSYKHLEGCELLLLKGKTDEERIHYRIFKAIISEGSSYIEDKYQFCSASLTLVEDVTPEVMAYIKENLKPNK